MRKLFFILAPVAPLLAGCGPTIPAEVVEASRHIPEVVDYNFHVRPILSENCFTCHGPDQNQRQADLRLDVAEVALKKAIVPRRPGRSELIRRVVSHDPEHVMPPPDSKLELSAEQKAILLRWIEQGAPYAQHWAFLPPQRAALPEARNEAWVRNPIDHFVLERLEKEQLTPSGEADRETLIRRVSFDLTGLPPSIEEVDRFLADTSVDAYEKVVDRLLAADAYGERMAYQWLDLARYADSDGYLDDKHREFSPWRDWVISAFNRNLPYDEFATWQLAGDLLPDATQEQVLATAFNRLHKKNSEAGIVFEEYRVEYVADRTQTLGTAFLGMTVDCARCHDHKYDPISHQDYYQLFAFFNSTFEIGTAVYGPGQTPGPALLLTTDEVQAQVELLEQEVKRQEEALAHQEREAEAGFEQWLERTDIRASLQKTGDAKLAAYYPFDEITFAEGNRATSPNMVSRSTPASLVDPVVKPGVRGNAYFISDYNRATLGDDIGWYDRTDPFTIDLWVYPDTLYDDAAVLLHTEELRLGLKGYSIYLEENRLKFIMAHSWPHNAIQIVTHESLPVREWSNVTVTYDGSSRAAGARIYIDGAPQPVETVYDNLYRGILFEPDIHTYGFAGVQFGQRSKFKPLKGGGIDEVRIFSRALSPLEVLYLNDPEQAETAIEDEQQLRAYYLAHAADLGAARAQLKQARDRLTSEMNRIPEIMVMGDLPEPRPTFILDRGMYDAPGEQVQPGAPESILPFSSDLPRNRLGLARWLFDADNPLTARVFVNRIWQMHFGTGLVRTADDFGNQGALPTHPELLDWLAVWFRESGWDIKALHRLIVTSATYRQASMITPELLERDPENTLLARGPRFRLPAEAVRDNALAASGLLVHKVGGPSVYPYQPEGLWDELSTKKWRYPYVEDKGEGLYRRSLYTIWKRTSPPPSMLIFDSPDRTVCTVQRQPTSTALQALVLLNDPQYVEAARVLAAGVIEEVGEDVEARLTLTFRLATGRRPDAHEIALLKDFYAGELAAFRENPEKARAYLSTGEAALSPRLSPAETAALAVVANGIMNTNEGFMRK